MHYWLLISNISLVVFRFLHFVGQAISGDDSENVLKFNWPRVRQLRKLSFLLLLVVFPFFVTWTALGTHWFVKSNYESPDCVTQ